jgi:membrane fusion protein (multidrug efflux system)
VEVRARVEGFLEKVLFREGSRVKAGQLIFIIDQRPYKAALQDARGQLAQAQAAYGKANKDVERLRPLVTAQAAPQQDLDRAESEAEFSTASIEKARAAIARAELDLKFTELRSPITGIIGREEVTVGNLVSRDRTLLTTISSWEPMRVVFSISESDYLKLVSRFPTFRSQAELGREAIFELLLADGSRYPHLGRLSFVDRALDATTGTLRIFVSFSNPEMILKPGLFGRIRFPLEERAGALLIPQRAVQRIQDVETVLVVGADNTVTLRTVTLGERIHDSFIVTSGLSPGELVVVEGLQNVLPGQRVNPLPPPGGQEQRGG